MSPIGGSGQGELPVWRGSPVPFCGRPELGSVHKDLCGNLQNPEFLVERDRLQ